MRRVCGGRRIAAHIDVMLELAPLHLGDGLADLGARFHDCHGLAVEAGAGMSEFVERGVNASGPSKEFPDFR